MKHFYAGLGAPYGWSAVSPALTRECGVVASAAGDWGLDLATVPMTIMIGGGGVAAALLGKCQTLTLKTECPVPCCPFTDRYR